MPGRHRTRYVLAVDLGTSGAKVALVGIDGRVVGWEFEPVELIVLPGGGAEQRPDDWWRAVVAATRRLLARHAGPAADVAAVCCCTQGEGTVPVDEDGAPLTNCILWMDMRGAPHLRRQFGGLPAMQGVSLLKVRRWVKLTGGMPSPTGKDPAAHMLYIRDELPEVYERTYKFLNVLDYLNLRLTGRMAASYDSILTCWVTDNRDADDVRYDAALVRDCGIDADKLPEIVKCTEVLGRLTPAAAEELGLAPETQVVAGAIDTTAAAIGAGATDDFAVHLYLGTSSWMAAHVPFKKTDVSHSLASVPCALPGRYLLTALQATAGGNLTWLRDNVLYHKDELLAEAELPDVFKILDQIARARAAGQQRRALHAVDLGRARARGRPHPARRPATTSRWTTRARTSCAPSSRASPSTRAGCSGRCGKFLGRPVETHQPGRRRRRSRTSGARSSPTCSA